MPVITLHSDQPFSLDQTLGCGQVFRWDRAPDGTWWGVVGDYVIRIRQDGRKLVYDGTSRTFIRELLLSRHGHSGRSSLPSTATLSSTQRLKNPGDSG